MVLFLECKHPVGLVVPVAVAGRKRESAGVVASMRHDVQKEGEAEAREILLTGDDDSSCFLTFCFFVSYFVLCRALLYARASFSSLSSVTPFFPGAGGYEAQNRGKIPYVGTDQPVDGLIFFCVLLASAGP